MKSLQFGLVGNPVNHSWSANYFNTYFKRNGIDAEYNLFCIDSVDELPIVISNNSNLIGLNVTSPFKTRILKYVDFLTEEAESVGAVNTILIKRCGNDYQNCGLNGLRLIGHNTDVIGFEILLGELPIVSDTRALVLGTGGASHAVARALQLTNIPFDTVSRTEREGSLTYDEVNPELIESRQLIINATPLGMGKYRDTVPRLPYDKISSSHIVVDLIYNPPVTEFMKRCAAQGATIKNGLSMLHGQAKAAWNFWMSESSNVVAFTTKYK